MAQNIQIVRDAPKVGRVTRSPKHTFVLKQKPFTIQPFMIAPVWPGDTMTNLLVQANVQGIAGTKKSRGWWYEMYFFYVKLRDLDARDDIISMLMDPEFDNSGLLDGATKQRLYFKGNGNPGTINWTEMCLKSVVDNYFRDEGEAWNVVTHDGLPVASVNQNSIFDSFKRESDVPAGGNDHELPGENPVIPDNVPAGFETHFTQWEQMRAMQLTEATFEDWLKSFGVKPPRELKVDEIHRPELLRYIRDWQYPQVSLLDDEGTTGFAPRWKMSERADKERFFAEPGFIFGVSVMRPKIMYGAQTNSGVALMDNAYAWLPAALLDQPYTSLRRVDGGDDTATIWAGGADYWVDIRDLAVHGDQFSNYQLFNDAGGSEVLQAFDPEYAPVLPHPSDGTRRFLTSAQIAAMQGSFADAEVDGIVNLSILSRLTDTSL